MKQKIIGSGKLQFQRRLDLFFGKILCFMLYPTTFFRLKNNEIKDISIVKLSGIGDGILLLPLIKKIKEQKKIKIKVICGRENYPIFEGINFIDEMVVFDILNKNIFVNFIKILKIMFKKTDYGIDFSQSSFYSTILTYLSSKRCSGFYNEKMGFFRNSLIKDKIKYKEKEHVIFNFFNLAEKTNIKYEKENITLIKPVFSERDYNSVKNLINYNNVVGIHPCNVLNYRAWPKEYFKEVISYILKNYKYQVVLMGSKSEEKLVEDLYNLFEPEEKNNVINIAGKVSIKEAMALISRLKLFIANDGGLMHIAASFNIPTIGIFGSDTPIRYAPFNNESFSFYSSSRCSPCNKPQDYSWKKCDNPVCLNRIKPKNVISKINHLLK